MTIQEAYNELGLDYTVDEQTFRNRAFELRKKYYLEKKTQKLADIDVATRVVYNAIKMEKEKLSPDKPEDKPYEFYEHMHDIPKAKPAVRTSETTIPFEQILRNEFMLNQAKQKIRDYLFSIINRLDYIYDLDRLQQFIDSSGIDQLIKASPQTSDKRHK